MSLLPSEVHSALSQLLRALTAADNALRSQAEEQLNNDWAQNRPDVLLMGLVEQIQGAEDTIVSVLLAGLESEKGRGGVAVSSPTKLAGYFVCAERIGSKTARFRVYSLIVSRFC